MIERPDVLRACIGVAGDWLAVGLDRGRNGCRLPVAASRHADPRVPRGGARRVGRQPARPEPRRALAGRRAPRILVRRHDADILVAGGATDLDGVRRLRDAGIAGVILGEALLSGAIDFPRALEAAA